MSEQSKELKIERYLSGQMTEAEAASFEADLRADRTLAEEVQLLREMRAEFGDPDKAAFMEALRAADQAHFEPPANRRTSGHTRWLLLICAMLVVAATAYFFWPVDEEPATDSSDPFELQDTPPHQPEVVPEGQILSEAERPDPVERPEPLDGGVEESASELLAAASFEPNPYLESFMNASVRSTATQTTAQASWSPEGTLVIEGTLDLPAGSAREDYAIYVYTNDTDAYLNEQFFERRNMTRSTSGDDDRFRMVFEKNYQPGLYYYLIMNDQADDPLLVGKIQKQ
ncbi:MAG: hypothetical protein R3301_15225 [Saprospiraceae bacterium]|nr:hypothetical protein [Saprospiraceae bacterium]